MAKEKKDEKVQLVTIQRSFTTKMDSGTIALAMNGLSIGKEEKKEPYRGLVAVSGRKIVGMSSGKEGWAEPRTKPYAIDTPEIGLRNLRFREKNRQGFWIGEVSDIYPLQYEVYCTLKEQAPAMSQANLMRELKEELSRYQQAHASPVFDAYVKIMFENIESFVSSCKPSPVPEMEGLSAKLFLKCLRTKGKVEGLRNVMGWISSSANHEMAKGGKHYAEIRELERKFGAKIGEYEQLEIIRLFPFDYPVEE